MLEQGDELGGVPLLVLAQLAQAAKEERVLARAYLFEGPLARRVMRTRALRRSLASAIRVTMPASLRPATILVIVGGCTCSTAASSPRVGLP